MVKMWYFLQSAINLSRISGSYITIPAAPRTNGSNTNAAYWLVLNKFSRISRVSDSFPFIGTGILETSNNEPSNASVKKEIPLAAIAPKVSP